MNVELMDVYDKDRLPTGRTAARGMLEAGDLILIVHVCLFDREGNMLIQKRHPDKVGWPGLWDLSVGGGAQAGETSAQAGQRECLEEIGLSIDLGRERPYFTVHFPTGFDDFYLLDTDAHLSDLRLQPQEVTQVRWASRDEILAMTKDGSFIDYYPGLIDLLFDMRLGRGCFPKVEGGV